MQLKMQLTTEALEVFETTSAHKLQGFVRYDGVFPDGDSGLDPETLMTPSGIRAGPNLGRIANSLTDDLLGKLVSEGGCCFLYQHFSTLAHWPKRTHITGALEFHPDNLEALRRLAGYHKRGDIWVTAQRTLLDYLHLLNTCKVYLKEANGARLVYQAKIKRGCEFRGLAGLTFALDANSFKTEGNSAVVVIEDPTGKVWDCKVCGPDELGILWANVPARQLPQRDWVALAREADIELSREIEIKLLDGSQPVNLHLPRALNPN